MNSQQLEDYERCPRLAKWSSEYLSYRVSPLRALYAALDAGLVGNSPEDHLMALAANPGLDVQVADVYGVAKHLAKLAEILSFYLRAGGGNWTRMPKKNGWVPDVYEWEDGIRRVVLVDRWSEERKLSEIRSWRTVAEIAELDKPMLMNFLVIGSTSEGKRVSPWSRALSHPKNNQLRFKKKNGSGGFTESWEQVWRERWPGTTEQWLAKMQSDGVFADLVHSVKVPVSPRREEFKCNIASLREEILALPDNPPMRRSGCYRFGACRFIEVCHGFENKTPAECGWLSLKDLKKSGVELPSYANVG